MILITISFCARYGFALRISLLAEKGLKQLSNRTSIGVIYDHRRPDTSTPIGPADYITNHLAYQFNQRPGFAGINEFLGCLENSAPGTAFDDPSTHIFTFAPRSSPDKRMSPTDSNETTVCYRNVKLTGGHQASA